MSTGQGKTVETYLRTAGSRIKTADKFYAQFKESNDTDWAANKMSQLYYNAAKDTINRTKEKYNLPESVEILFNRAKKETEERRKK